MANIKISQLPEFSGSPDGTWIVLNNSGETTTSKILREDFFDGRSPFIAGSQDYSVVNDYNLTSDIAGKYQGIILGTGNTITESAAKQLAIISSTNSNISDMSSNDTYGNHGLILSSLNSNIASTSTAGGFNTIIGSHSATINGNSQYNLILNAYDGDITGGGTSNTIISGDGNKINSTGQFNPAYSIIAGGYSNVMNGGSNGNVILAGNSNTISSAGPVGIIQSSNSSINGGNYNATIIGATAASMTNSGHSLIGGGYGNQISNSYCAFVSGRGNQFTGSYNDCEGGMYSTWNGVSSTAGKATMMGGGNSNRLQTTSDYAVLLGGESNTMTTAPNSFMAGSNSSTMSASTNSAIIASVSSSIDTKDRAVMIGTSSESALYSATTHVQNIHTFQTETFDVYDAGNVGGSIDVDCTLATIYKFTMTADTTPNFVSPKTGQRFIFIIYNSGAYAVPTATVNGVSSTVMVKNGSLNPTNSGYSKYTATYDGSLLFLDEELNFQAV